MRLLKLFSLLLAIAVSSTAFGQQLLVQYDYLNDDFNYYRLGSNGSRTQISRPVVTRNHNVKVEVINLNPFVYSAVASYSTKEFVQAPSIDFFSLISPLSLPTGGSSFLTKVTGFGDTTRGSDVMNDPNVRSAYEAIEETYKTLYQAEQMMNNIDFVLSKVHKLKYNPYLPGDTIKSFTQSLMNDLFSAPDVKTKDFLDLANKLNSTVKGDLMAFNANVDAFDEAYNLYVSNSREATFSGKGIDKVVHGWAKQATAFVQEFDSDLLIDKLDELEVMYQSVMNTPYSFNTNDIAKGDLVTVKIDFYRNTDNEDNVGESVESLPKVKSKEIDITVKGGLKISSSVGLAFPYYADNSNFINRDSVITAVDGNNYTPNISALLNFYPYNGKNVQIGGTFGVGVPMSSDSKNFNFLMGMSTVFGQENQVVLSLGPTLGQVNQLDQGYQVGDNLGDLTREVPTRKAYQWGAFVGVSFTITKITK